MDTFPQLRTGAVLQYPSLKRVEYSTRVMTFIDGTEQRFREHTKTLQSWIVRLDKLTEDEIANVQGFVRKQFAGNSTFSFTDPWDDVVHSDCTLVGDEFEFAFDLEGRGSLSLVIRSSGG
jgi:hypothetical protein